MKLCFCRATQGISDREVKIHLIANPRLLGQDWAAVSFDMTDREMVCGTCEDEGNACLERLEIELAAAGVTAPSQIPA